MAAISNGRRFFARARRKPFAILGARNLTNTTQSASQYCNNLVRNLDYENYLCVLLLPKSSRTSVFAVRAFNVELARIQDAVSDQTIGRMRLQFWRDSLENTYQGNPPQQSVALELAEAITKHKLAKGWFSRLIDARERNLDNRPHETTNALEEHGENTVSSVLYLILECLGVKDVQADHAASHLGKAIAVVTLLRSTPFHGSKGKVYIPNNIMIKHGVSQEDIIRGRTTQPVKDVAYDLASLAHSHLSTAQSLMSKAPKAASRAFLPVVSCKAYLTKIQKADFNIFHPTLRERNHLLPLLLLKHAWTGL
ncbi:NADH dehydrogenase (ubiquinone) complex I, assembly factor 6 [Desmophyllum pertusum]|uniref:NADH dehydrogenase (ubiquinone) complex I, assembly factor 6 n=1 Tax=Desmophyllum pertusum TaxID=174260 RepID=A0A9X0CK80_9CNID|nr:NADH dehydrogenase (ubiquinone) complex I, assembly factor 6 [Desmophyllum pertusum]